MSHRAHRAWATPGWQARGEVDHALALLSRERPGDLEAATTLLAGAKATAGRLQMSALLQRIASAGGPPEHAGKGPPTPRTTLSTGLTPRETEVLRALASGGTNQEIAAALFISVHTVERHLANVYTKIGARGRADATRFAVEHLIV